MFKKKHIMEIQKIDGKIWGIKKDLFYGVWHYTKIYLGEDKEVKKEPSKKKTKKESEN